jgi:hypothetical protein
MTASRTRATGKINVTSYDPKPYDETVDPKIVEVHVVEEFTGDLVGIGTARFLQVLRGDGSASFVGVERFVGSLGGRSGSFVLQDAGTVQAGTVCGSWFVVPGSGTDELVGLRGEGGFEAALGEHASIVLEYWFD